MFLGEHQHSVDEKGRLVMPAKFRHRLADGIVVTKGKEGCLFAYPMDRWGEELDRMKSLPDTKENRNVARAFLGGASDQKLDKQGRVQLPQALRSFARLDKEVIVVGVGDLVEIWDIDAWARLSQQADYLYAEIDEDPGEEGT